MNVLRYVKVGIFFITMGTVGVSYVVISGDGFNRFNTKKYEIITDDATGLTTNSKVFMAGVPVGKIYDIELADGSAILTVSLLKTLDLHADAVVERRSSSILGTSILALNAGTLDQPIISPGGVINNAGGGGDMSALAGSAQDLAQQLMELITEFRSSQMELITLTLASFSSMATKFDARSEAELDRLTRVLESSALIAERLDRLLSEREGDLGEAAGEIRLAAEDLHAITSEIRGGNGNFSRALNEDGLYVSILQTAQQAEDIAGRLGTTLDTVDDIARDAGKFISKAAGLGVQINAGARYDIVSKSVHSTAGLRLEPSSADRWYRVGVSSNPDGQSQRTVTEVSTNGLPAVRTETVEIKPAFAFDAELARELGLFTLRGGIYENSPGVGLDFQPFSWLSLSGQVNEFSTKSSPNVRGSVTIYPRFDPQSNLPWNWIYLSGGIVSALNTGRDFYVSAGIRFADEEVRGLVGLIPLTK